MIARLHGLAIELAATLILAVAGFLDALFKIGCEPEDDDQR